MFDVKKAISLKQVQTAYDQLYRQSWLPPNDALFDWLIQKMDVHSGSSMLDIACGDAKFSQYAYRYGLKYHGIDISYEAANQVADRSVLVGDSAALPFPNNYFRYVTCIGSLEHALDIEQGVREMARVLKPDGKACILVPNAFSLTWNMLHVWRTGDIFEEDGQPIQRFGTRGAWERLLTNNGLNTVHVYGYERCWPQTRAEWHLYIDQPKEIVLGLAAPLMPINLARCFVFICTKRIDGQL